MVRKNFRVLVLIGLLLNWVIAEASEPLRVIATVPELGELARIVGPDQVQVKVLAKPTEDPHFVDPKPSFAKALNQADLFIQLGMDMETGWAPVLLKTAKNPDVLPGRRGHLDTSVAISPLEVPLIPVDRSMGDVHALGNPHYLVDPIEGLRVARLIRDKLVEMRPAETAYFRQRYAEFAERLARALVGSELAKRYGVEGVEKLARLHERGKMRAFLERQGELELLGGWLGKTSPHYGVLAVADHNMWPYFARRFGIQIVGHLEPKPGIPPSTKHLKELIAMMKAEDVNLVLTSVYYDPRHARFVSENTGATLLSMAHQAGARKGTEGYLEMVDYNVRQVVGAFPSGS